jgi:hypothetical protein
MTRAGPPVLSFAEVGRIYRCGKLPPNARWSPLSMPVPRSCEAVDGGGQVCVSSFGFAYRGDVRPDAAELATRTAAFVLVIGFAGTQVALLAGAAFAIGARRQRRELAMVGAVAGVRGVGLGALTYWLNAAGWSGSPTTR